MKKNQFIVIENKTESFGMPPEMVKSLLSKTKVVSVKDKVFKSDPKNAEKIINFCDELLAKKRANKQNKAS